MRIGEVLGSVTLCRSLPEMEGATLRLIRPLGLAELSQKFSQGQPPQEAASDAIAPAELVAWDEMGSGVGDLVAFSEGGEAAQPFRPALKPVDAYNAAILDRLELD